MGLIDLDLQGHFGLKPLDSREFETCRPSDNSSWIRARIYIFAENVCIRTLIRPLLKMESINLGLQGQLGLKVVELY